MKIFAPFETRSFYQTEWAFAKGFQEVQSIALNKSLYTIKEQFIPENYTQN